LYLKTIITYFKKEKEKKEKKELELPRSTSSIHLSLKIVTAFGQVKPQRLVFISSQYTYFGFSLGLHCQVKYIFLPERTFTVSKSNWLCDFFFSLYLSPDFRPGLVALS